MEPKVVTIKRSFRDLDDMWRRGISLSDKDLKDLQTYYQRLITALSIAPQAYKLMLDDATRQYNSVKHASDARKEKW